MEQRNGIPHVAATNEDPWEEEKEEEEEVGMLRPRHTAGGLVATSEDDDHEHVLLPSPSSNNVDEGNVPPARPPSSSRSITAEEEGLPQEVAPPAPAILQEHHHHQAEDDIERQMLGNDDEEEETSGELPIAAWRHSWRMTQRCTTTTTDPPGAAFVPVSLLQGRRDEIGHPSPSSHGRHETSSSSSPLEPKGIVDAMNAEANDDLELATASPKKDDNDNSMLRRLYQVLLYDTTSAMEMAGMVETKKELEDQDAMITEEHDAGNATEPPPPPTTTTVLTVLSRFVPSSFLTRTWRRQEQRKAAAAVMAGNTMDGASTSLIRGGENQPSHQHTMATAGAPKDNNKFPFSQRRSRHFKSRHLADGAGRMEPQPTQGKEGEHMECQSATGAPSDNNKFPFLQRRSRHLARRGLADGHMEPQQETQEDNEGQHRGRQQSQMGLGVLNEGPGETNGAPQSQTNDVGGQIMRIPLNEEQRRRMFGANRPDAQLPPHQQQPREHLPVARRVEESTTEGPTMKALVTTTSQNPHAVPLDEHQATLRQEALRRVAWFVGFLVVMLSAGMALGFGLFGGQSKSSDPKLTRKCFETTQELHNVSDRLMLLRRQNNFDPLVQAEIEQVYGPIEEWCVGSIQDFSLLFSIWRNPHMFAFDLNISGWNMSAATNTSWMFSGRPQDLRAGSSGLSSQYRVKARFNQAISNWDISNVVDMTGMFAGTSDFDQDLSGWNVSSVRDMKWMFHNTLAFNQRLSTWNVSNVQSMNGMFNRATGFNNDISRWTVSNVQNMTGMFLRAHAFNQRLSRWDVSKVTNMEYMFTGASSFNQDLSRWAVSRVETAFFMFAFAHSMNQNLCRWGDLLPKSANVSSMFFVTPCPENGAPVLTRNPPGPFCHACITSN